MTKDIINNFLYTDRLNTNIVQNKIILETTKTETIEDLKQSQKVVKLGRENKTREFKTSYVYYAESNSKDIEQQSFVILKTIAGFLNSEGGSLFLGVNDKGEISGLLNDYNALGKNINHDFYERRIRKDIVRYFDKDINGQIEFLFKTVNDLEYLEIVIPNYQNAISLIDRFYQRQGNETRELLGNDIIKFISRKLLNSQKQTIEAQH
jgi:predicted HTH transcriptional regulator